MSVKPTINKMQAENILDSTKAIKDFAVDTAGKLKSTLGDLNQFLGFASPITIPLKVLGAQITEGTFAASMGTMEATMDLIASPAAQEDLSTLIRVISKSLQVATMITTKMTAFLNTDITLQLARQLLSMQTRIETTIVDIVNHICAIKNKLITTLTAEFQMLVDRGDVAVDKVQNVLDRVGNIFKNLF